MRPQRPRNGRNAQAWTDAEKEAALQLAEEVGAAAAGRELGVSPGTIRSWRSRSGKITQPPSGADPSWAEAKLEAAQKTWKTAEQALAKVRKLLDADKMGDAQRAAIVMAVMFDKADVHTIAAQRVAEAEARIAESQARQIAAALEHLLTDLGLPASPAVRRVLAAYLRDATDAEAIELAKQEVRAHYEALIERERGRSDGRSRRANATWTMRTASW